MSEREEKRGGSGCAIGLVIILLLLPVLYVLGLGPAELLAARFPESVGFLDVIYAPLAFVVDHCEPLGKSLDWYMSFWP